MFYQVRDRFDRLYQAEQARRWIEPAVTEWPARGDDLVTAGKRAAFMQQLNERFGLAHLRPMDAADMQATEDREADFDAFVDKSDAAADAARRAAGRADAVLVRVQRRPLDGRPPRPVARAAALRRRSSQPTSRRNGGVFIDDTGDPAQTLDMYEDGDHLSREGRRRYTEVFATRLRQRFP